MFFSIFEADDLLILYAGIFFLFYFFLFLQADWSSVALRMCSVLLFQYNSAKPDSL